ncbi:unnamed protein product [Acanthoscelides obtectus]|uniref:MADF domain-containing protein n=1 Tax=Acanthoscelides obtectus TaxID=200917 RepID=A0A9P0M5Z4_ACAOB|nr:unnamed protein product [Acanthoscelides obtectus]CAK1635024.1 hypothetical protein AOBTE_LOCUS9006 [Acanthoscelides obtectus]
MDKELLIAAVFERTAIWNKRDKLHSNRNVVDRYWKEISIEIKQDEAKIRKQWKYLRDQFSVELGKLPPPRSGDAAEDLPTSKWPYFTQLLFLKDVIKPRAASGNLSMMQSAQSTQETEEIQSSNENSDNEESSRESEGCVVPPTPISRKTNPTSASITAQRKRRTATDAYQESMLEIEKRKVEYLENKAKRGCNDQDDEHMSFFKSLLPHRDAVGDSKWKRGGGCCINAKKRRNDFVVTSEQGVIGRVTTSEILLTTKAQGQHLWVPLGYRGYRYGSGSVLRILESGNLCGINNISELVGGTFKTPSATKIAWSD